MDPFKGSVKALLLGLLTVVEAIGGSNHSLSIQQCTNMDSAALERRLGIRQH